MRADRVADSGFGCDVGSQCSWRLLYSKAKAAKKAQILRSNEICHHGQSAENELPPHLPCGQFRRCAEACGAGPARRLHAEARTGRSGCSTPMPASAFTTCPARRRRRPAEWRDGIGRLWRPICPPQAHVCLRPISSAVRDLNRGRRPSALSRLAQACAHAVSPAGPALGDGAASGRLYAACTVCSTATSMRRVTRARRLAGTGAHLPPKEKRGIVLVDPPFEDRGRIRAAGRWARQGVSALSGRHLLPVVSAEAGRAHRRDSTRACRLSAFPRCSVPELLVRSDRDITGLTGSGLIVVNPPFTLKDELHALLPALKEVLARDEEFASSRAFLAARRTMSSGAARGRH